jgi:uncharacterized repeat protein (TIGR01451 family)
MSTNWNVGFWRTVAVSFCVVLCAAIGNRAHAQATSPRSAEPDAATTVSGVPVTINHLSNDSPGFAAWSITVGPANGTVRTLDSAIEYTPNSTFVGTEVIAYGVCYTRVLSGTCSTPLSIAEITITVGAPMRAVNDTVSIDSGATIDVRVQDNDSFRPSTNPSLRIVRAPASGTATVITRVGGISLAFTPPVIYDGIRYVHGGRTTGIDSLDYEICRNLSTFPATDCAVGTLTISVAGPPITVADRAATIVGQIVTVDVLANDTGFAPFASLAISTPPARGTASVVANRVQYTAGSTVGTESLQYEVCRRTVAGPSCSIGAVTIDVAAAPIAVDDSVLATANRSVTIPVTRNDSGIAPSSLSIVTLPLNGVVSARSDGSTLYTPTRDFIGIDSFRYQVCSVVVPSICVTAEVSVNVGRPVSDFAVSKAVVGTVRVGGAVEFTITVTNAGPEPSIGEVVLVDDAGADLTLTQIVEADVRWRCELTAVRIVCQTSTPFAVGESASIRVAATISNTPTTNASGLCASSNVAAVSLVDTPSSSRDGDGSNDAARVLFDILSAPPVAVADSTLGLTNRSVSVNPIRNDRTNLCGGNLNEQSVELIPNSQIGDGTFARAADGSIAFQPAPGFRGVASIRYTILDGRGQRSNEATITVNVLPPNFYVSNFNDGTVSVIDIEAASANAAGSVSSVAVPAAPDGIVVTAGGDSVYVASYVGNTITQIDGLTKSVVRQIPITGGPLAMGLLGNGSLLVAQYDSGAITVLPTNGTGTSRTLTLGRQPSGLVVAGSNIAYIALRGEDRVVRVNTDSLTVTGSIPVGEVPAGIAINTARNELYVANGASNTMSIIDLATDKVVATVPLNGLSPGAIAVSRDGRKAYVSMFYSNSIAVVDLATRTLSGSVAVGRNPTGVSIDFTGTRLLVSEFGDNTMSVIDLGSTERRTQTIRVGNGPASFGQFVAQP